VEERAGVVLPPKPADRDWPRMDPPNVLWFFGAFAIAFAIYALFDALPDSHNSLWIFLAAVAFLLVFAGASWFLLAQGSWVPGGLAAALAVSMVPAATIGLLDLVTLWPDNPGGIDEFSGWSFGVAMATALAGLVAFWLTGFSFIFAVVVGAILLGSQFLAASFESPASGDDRATTALIAGSLLVITGVFMDAFGRRRDAFWFHVLGWLSVAAGLIFFTIDPGGNHDRGWIPMLVAGALMLIVAGPIRRASWAVYGVLGYYAPIVHYMVDGLNEDRWPFALLLLAVGLSIFGLGTLMHRYGRVWSERFIRRPPPAVVP
jgi:hypothetical protein